jgi:hypothetical protein
MEEGSVKVYEMETRKCKDCKHFFAAGEYYHGCRKHLRTVSPDMQVVYKIADGTCWESV